MAKTSLKRMKKELSIGERVHSWRTASGKTQTQLENAAGLGHNAISRIEKDEVSPRVETLEKIANALEISFEALHLTEPPKEKEVCKAEPLLGSLDERLMHLPPALAAKARNLMHQWINLLEETK